MRAAIVSVLAIVLILSLTVSSHHSPAADDVVKTDPKTPANELKTFHVPPGFEVQLVASEPDIHKPLNMAFDDRGRLWVTDTLEYPFAAPPTRKARDTVKI